MKPNFRKLLLTGAMTAALGTAALPGTASATPYSLGMYSSVYSVLIGLVGVDAHMLAMQNSLNNASSQEMFTGYLHALLPYISLSSYITIMQAINMSTGMTGNRLAALRTGDYGSGMATGNISHGLNAWAQLMGGAGQQGARDGLGGYDYYNYGVAAGVDTENIADALVAGIAFSYVETVSDADNVNSTDSDVDSWQVTLYGEYDIDSRTYLNGQLAYTYSNTDTTRYNLGGVTGLTANGEFDSNQLTARFEVGRDYGFKGVTLTPNVMAHWTRYDPDSYSETGAGGAGLNVDGDAVDIVELGIGVDAGWDIRNADGTRFVPTLSAGIRHDFANDRVETTSSFIGGGQSFEVQGFDVQQTAVDLGAGFTFYSTGNWEVAARYDYEWKQDFDGHAGLVRASYRF